MSYTVDIGNGLKVCVNARKRPYWVYGGQIECRNEQWQDPEAPRRPTSPLPHPPPAPPSCTYLRTPL